ncbi:hypothetical protein VP01_4498g1 [Puccinia sorghi]|uniref:Uncharacterized protein n=1 Tax=Puccinia sorghi TaxID=27349 RepID=A0A0L6UP42_9BASI|nr:hypothetical protein VP01_4498g1 [Puccinia sorghi]
MAAQSRISRLPTQYYGPSYWFNVETLKQQKKLKNWSNTLNTLFPAYTQLQRVTEFSTQQCEKWI